MTAKLFLPLVVVFFVAILLQILLGRIGGEILWVCTDSCTRWEEILGVVERNSTIRDPAHYFFAAIYPFIGFSDLFLLMVSIIYILANSLSFTVIFQSISNSNNHSFDIGSWLLWVLITPTSFLALIALGRESFIFLSQVTLFSIFCCMSEIRNKKLAFFLAICSFIYLSYSMEFLIQIFIFVVIFVWIRLRLSHPLLLVGCFVLGLFLLDPFFKNIMYIDLMDYVRSWRTFELSRVEGGSNFYGSIQDFGPVDAALVAWFPVWNVLLGDGLNVIKLCILSIKSILYVAVLVGLVLGFFGARDQGICIAALIVSALTAIVEFNQLTFLRHIILFDFLLCVFGTLACKDLLKWH